VLAADFNSRVDAARAEGLRDGARMAVDGLMNMGLEAKSRLVDTIIARAEKGET
jgi:hypothetical protein